MYSLEEFAGRIAEAVEKMRKGAVGCFVIRPKHVFGNRSPVHNSTVAYIFSILTRAGLAIRYETARGVKYLVCKDSWLYALPKEEMTKRIVEEVRRAEEKN